MNDIIFTRSNKKFTFAVAFVLNPFAKERERMDALEAEHEHFLRTREQLRLAGTPEKRLLTFDTEHANAPWIFTRVSRRAKELMTADRYQQALRQAGLSEKEISAAL